MPSLDSGPETAWAHTFIYAMPKRSSYTAAFKLKVVETAEKVGNRSAGREHLVSEKLVRDWRKKKAVLSALPKRTSNNWRY